jgi:hypothetical protein
VVAKAVMFPRDTNKKRMIISAYPCAFDLVSWERIK